MFALLGWLVIGLIAGALARLLVPGRQSMGIMMTMILGLVGSVVGGVISGLIFGYDPLAPGFQPAGLLMSTLGAIIVLIVFVRSRRSNAAP